MTSLCERVLMAEHDKKPETVKLAIMQRFDVPFEPGEEPLAWARLLWRFRSFEFKMRTRGLERGYVKDLAKEWETCQNR